MLTSSFVNFLSKFLMFGGGTCNLLECSASEEAVQCGEEASSSKAHIHVKPWDIFQTLFYVKHRSKFDVFKKYVLKAGFCCQVWHKKCCVHSEFSVEPASENSHRGWECITQVEVVCATLISLVMTVWIHFLLDCIFRVPGEAYMRFLASEYMLEPLMEDSHDSPEYFPSIFVGFAMKGESLMWSTSFLVFKCVPSWSTPILARGHPGEQSHEAAYWS